MAARCGTDERPTDRAGARRVHEAAGRRPSGTRLAAARPVHGDELHGVGGDPVAEVDGPGAGRCRFVSKGRIVCVTRGRYKPVSRPTLSCVPFINSFTTEPACA